MSKRGQTGERGSVSSFLRVRLIFALVVALAIAAAGGCASLSTDKPDPLAARIDFMKRAAEADRHVWEEMKTDAEHRANSDPLESRLQLGFLLTSPSQGEPNTEAGEKILGGVLESETALDPRLRDLIQVRLKEVETRRVLSGQLRDVKGKIQELLSIESSMEQRKSQTETRRR